MGEDILLLLIGLEVLVLLTVGSEKVVELVDETADRGDKLDEALGDEDNTEVVAGSSTVGYRLGDAFYNLVEGHVLLLYFL